MTLLNDASSWNVMTHSFHIDSTQRLYPPKQTSKSNEVYNSNFLATLHIGVISKNRVIKL